MYIIQTAKVTTFKWNISKKSNIQEWSGKVPQILICGYENVLVMVLFRLIDSGWNFPACRELKYCKLFVDEGTR